MKYKVGNIVVIKESESGAVVGTIVKLNNKFRRYDSIFEYKYYSYPSNNIIKYTASIHSIRPATLKEKRFRILELGKDSKLCGHINIKNML